jgi:ABC-type nickel/cobalt efflux system permease component RcnA
MAALRGLQRCLLSWTWILLLNVTPGRAHELNGTEVATSSYLSITYRSLSGRYEIQFGELSAFEQRKRMDADGSGTITASERNDYLQIVGDELAGRLLLEVEGKSIAVQLHHGRMIPDDPIVAPGALTLGFKLTTEVLDFTRGCTLVYRDTNSHSRLVHSEVVVEGMERVDIDRADSGDGALKKVHIRSAQAPLQVRVVLKPSSDVTHTGAPAEPAPHGDERHVEVETLELQEMLRSEEVSIDLVVLALALSFFLGAAHALEPGHGKTIVAAYLIGNRGTVANAVYLGGVVTITHTFSVIILGLVTLFASNYILPETIFPWLGTGSGLLIMGLGGWLFARSLVSGGNTHVHSQVDEEEHHLRQHHHHHHVHPPRGKVTPGSLLTLGISGGIVPCPGALVILLLAVALHRIGFGLLLIVSFSFGLATVLIAIGILMVKARPLVDRFSGGGTLIRRLPLVSSLVIILAGFIIGVRALVEAGIVVINL